MALFSAARLALFRHSAVRSYHGRCRIGNRDVVGYGVNGSYNYRDDPHFPFPAIRFKENTKDVCALREKERCDWRQLSCDEKRALYRASFAQTFVEMKQYTGAWKFILGYVLFMIAIAFHGMTFFHYFVYEPLPRSFCKDAQKAQLRRMIELHVNPIDGLASKWDYENDRWK